MFDSNESDNAVGPIIVGFILLMLMLVWIVIPHSG